MSAIQSHAGMGPSWSDAKSSSPAMQLLGESQLGGVLDVRALADGVAQLNPQGLVQALQELTNVLPPLDLARLVSDLGQVLEAPLGGLTGGVRDVLGEVVGSATQTIAPLSPELARRVDGAVVGLGLTRTPETGGAPLLRSEQVGLGESIDRTLGQIAPQSAPQGGQTSEAMGLAGAAELAIGATTETERSAVVGRNEATWTLDALGRPVRAEATLREVFTDLDRSSAETRAQGEAADRGVEGDHGGHIIGHRFVKDQGLDNLFPQNGDFNISAYKTFENEMADWVEAGAEVRVTVDLLGGGDRPVQVRVAYEVLNAADGNAVYENNVLFQNAADQTFDRTPSSDMKAMLDG